MLPEGIEATPHDAPAGLHYLYQRRDIFVATDDYERLFATKVEALAAVGVRKADPCDPESRHPSRDEVLADLGFTRLRTISDDVYLPQAVIDLRAPQHVRNARTGRVEEVLPRVSPNHVMSLHPHASWHTGGPVVAAGPLSKPPRPGGLPLAGEGVTIGLLDTGMWTGRLDWYNGNVQVDANDEDRLDDDDNDVLQPDDGHGTFIAGLMQAHAPGAKIQVDALYGTPEGYGAYITDEDLSGAINKMANSGVDIINLSLGGATHHNSGLPVTGSTLENLRVSHPHLVVVASAGNDRSSEAVYPAAFKRVIGVAAVTGEDERADFSNFGEWVNMSAPGEKVHSTFVRWDKSIPIFDGFATWSGTSFATAKVAAAIATRFRPGGTQLAGSLPKNAREAADRLENDPTLGRVVGLGTIVRPTSYVS